MVIHASRSHRFAKGIVVRTICSLVIALRVRIADIRGENRHGFTIHHNGWNAPIIRYVSDLITLTPKRHRLDSFHPLPALLPGYRPACGGNGILRYFFVVLTYLGIAEHSAINTHFIQDAVEAGTAHLQIARIDSQSSCNRYRSL